MSTTPSHTDGLISLEAREIDGKNNNLSNPEFGAAETQFTRIGSADYADGEGAVQDRGNIREISNAIADQEASIPNSNGSSDLLTFFGQFIDHDIDLTKGGSGEQLLIPIPADDGVFNPAIPLTLERSGFEAGTGENGVPREQINEITSFLDVSNIYGSKEELTKLLRADTGDSAYLLTDANGHAPTMGQLREIYPNIDIDHPGLLAGDVTDEFYVSGDVRTNENIALTSIHSIWISEHNKQVDNLRADHPDWTEDQLFDAAKIIVEAEYQNVVFNEYLPTLLGAENIPAYAGYDDTVNAAISTEFATAAYRLGHSQLNDVFRRIEEDGTTNSDGNIGLKDAFFAPGKLSEGGGINSIVRGLAGNKSQDIDVNIVDAVRNLLFANSGAGTDLASLNLLRGRDHGIETLNDMRVSLGLTPYTSFADLTSDTELQQQFAEVYTTIDDVDLWIGGLAEEKVPGSQLGETFHKIVLEQFLALRDGDRFYYETRLADMPDLLAQINETTFSDIITRNTDIEHMQDDAFAAHTRIGGTDYRDVLLGTTSDDLILGFEGDDVLIGLGGNDDFYGGAGDDYIIGGAGNDIIFGEEGDDVMLGRAGNDQINGGSGVDWMNGGAGDDTLIGGNDHDVIFGAAGKDILFGDSDGTISSGETAFDSLTGGEGNDYLIGDAYELNGTAWASHDYLSGGKGDDIIIGDAVSMSGSAQGGDDHILGGAGNDTIFGDAVSSLEDAEGGHDFIMAGSGDDVINGGGGHDYMVGGAGNDTFVFGPGSGEDIIADFSQEPGNQDKIDVSGYGHDAFEDVGIIDIYEGTVIDFGDGNDVVLLGVDSATLSEDDFFFA